MSLLIVVLFEVDVEVANDDGARDYVAQKQAWKHDDLHNGDSLHDLCLTCEHLNEHHDERGCEDHSTCQSVGPLGFLDAFNERSEAELATVEVYAHRNEQPLVQRDTESDAEEQAACMVEQFDGGYRQITLCETADVQQHDDGDNQFAEKCQLQE